jgi:hypothetical protein
MPHTYDSPLRTFSQNAQTLPLPMRLGIDSTALRKAATAFLEQETLTPHPNEEKPVLFYLVVAGQSNAVGVNYGMGLNEGVSDPLEAAEEGQNPFLKQVASDGRLAALQEPLLHLESSPYSTSISFATTVAHLIHTHWFNASQHVHIAVLPAAKGGSCVAPEPHPNGSWHPEMTGEHAVFPLFQARLRAFRRRYPHAVCLGTLWHQGESDSVSLTRQTHYENNTHSVLHALLNAECGPIVCGTMYGADGPYVNGAFLSTQKRALQSISEKEPFRIFWVDTSRESDLDLMLIDDGDDTAGGDVAEYAKSFEPMNVHFTGLSHRHIGAALFTKLSHAHRLHFDRRALQVAPLDADHYTGSYLHVPENLCMYALGVFPLIKGRLVLQRSEDPKAFIFEVAPESAHIFTWSWAKLNPDEEKWTFSNGITIEGEVHTLHNKLYQIRFPRYESVWSRYWYEGEWRAPGRHGMTGRVVIDRAANSLKPKEGHEWMYSWSHALLHDIQERGDEVIMKATFSNQVTATLTMRWPQQTVSVIVPWWQPVEYTR